MTAPDTIVLIHGFWVTRGRGSTGGPVYEAKGFTVHTPAYPGFEVEVEALRDDPHHRRPDPRGRRRPTSRHSSTPSTPQADPDGSLRQWFLRPSRDGPRLRVRRRRAQLGTTEGIRTTPWTQLHSMFPALKNPLNHHRAVGVRRQQWKYAFTNTYTDEESLAFYERYHIPASGRVLFDSVLANFKPGHQDAWVDFKNPNRAPLLFLSGSEDHIMPPSVQASNAKHYKARDHHRARDLRRASTPDGRRTRLGRDRRPGARVGAGPRDHMAGDPRATPSDDQSRSPTSEPTMLF